MRMHHVEVDEEVFSFVKAHAEPLVDTFNSSLRRWLPLVGPNEQKPTLEKTNISLIPSVPTGTPEALRQILEVVRLVLGGAYARTAATQFVAKQHGVFPQTVLDKYCRQLQLTARQFDRLLEEDGLVGLRSLLKSKFSAHTDVIENVLNLGDTSAS